MRCFPGGRFHPRVGSRGTGAAARGARRLAGGARPEPRRHLARKRACIEKWALNGENFLWRVAVRRPLGARSSWATASTCRTRPAAAPTLQERVMALDADTGKVVWEYKFNIFQSDVPPHRVGWASPAADPETGNIYALGVGAHGHRAQQGRQAALGALDRRGVRRLHHARRPDDVAAHRRRPGDRQRRDLELGHAGATARTASSRSTSAPATSSRSPTRAAVRTTRPTPRRLIATINGTAAADRRPRRRRRSTRSSRRPARRSGASSRPSAPSTPASSSRAPRVIVSHGDENLDIERARA